MAGRVSASEAGAEAPGRYFHFRRHTPRVLCWPPVGEHSSGEVHAEAQEPIAGLPNPRLYRMTSCPGSPWNPFMQKQICLLESILSTWQSTPSPPQGRPGFRQVVRDANDMGLLSSCLLCRDWSLIMSPDFLGMRDLQDNLSRTRPEEQAYRGKWFVQSTGH